ncbi:hypothetical protein CHS0354_020045 [Potamilus streckersoni]|uniref:Uncharacterized protein n=1 Tax=Potamilus streckersoni TaxID=2493646 RepID=A0AAE0SLY0_9BIVA|nr:hypothetical protein CHS0354_020045 [Potamilus streckersoni]
MLAALYLENGWGDLSAVCCGRSVSARAMQPCRERDSNSSFAVSGAKKVRKKSLFRGYFPNGLTFCDGQGAGRTPGNISTGFAAACRARGDEGNEGSFGKIGPGAAEQTLTLALTLTLAVTLTVGKLKNLENAWEYFLGVCGGVSGSRRRRQRGVVRENRCRGGRARGKKVVPREVRGLLPRKPCLSSRGLPA